MESLPKKTCERLEHLDLCKASAILLVVFYHSITLLPITNEKINIISALIEPFHVSVFYLISGFLFSKSLKNADGGGGGKCIVYLYKYTLLTLIFGSVQGCYIFFITKNDFASCVVQGFYNYWFFPVLVLGYVFIFFVYKINLKWFIVIPVWLIFFFFMRNSSMFMRIAFFPFLMYLGTVFRNSKFSVMVQLVICILLFAVVSVLLIGCGYDSTYNGKTGLIGMIGFLNLIPGSMILPLFLEYIESRNRIRLPRLISFIGKNTLVIYILHYFIKLPLVDFNYRVGWLYFAFSYLLIVFGTLFAVFLYRKLKDFVLKCKNHEL